MGRSTEHIQSELDRMIRAFNTLLSDFSEQSIDLEIEREEKRQLALALKAATDRVNELLEEIRRVKHRTGTYRPFLTDAANDVT